MAFQRSYSKVWWGSDYNQSPTVVGLAQTTQFQPTTVNVSTVAADVGCYASNYLTSMHTQQQRYQQQQQQPQYHSLDYNNLRAYAANLSRIQEVDDAQNMSKISWEKRHSPGSLRSQDSGFSDNDESQSTRSLGRHSKPSSPGAKSNLSQHNSSNDNSPVSSPHSTSSHSHSHIDTPPTVVRRIGRSQFYSPLVSVSRRISFTLTTTENATASEDESTTATDLLTLDAQFKQKRRRRVSRQFNKPLSPNRAKTPDTIPSYHNETVYLGADSSLNCSELSPAAHSSTPKKSITASFDNPLLNGHAPALQQWLSDMKTACEPEVMSTLQTKSIAQQAFKNLSITTNTVTKLVRQLQQRAAALQMDFERLERILNGEQAASLQTAFNSATQLIEHVQQFSAVLQRRTVFFTQSREQRRRFDDQLDQIRLLVKDTRYSLEKQHYINIESLLDDVHILYRNLESIIRLVFERMLGVLVQSIENSRCDLLLRANINMIATLANIDYMGLASLNDAFVQNEAVRALLLICLDHELTSVRALALRALAMICNNREAIDQLSECEGIEILRDILNISAPVKKRGDIERREAVSLLTQITAVWHGPEHRVEGLKDCIEAMVEGLTQLVAQTSCAQTLLLCAAALNNLSHIEVTSHYSIMSNETISKLIAVVEQKEAAVSIFLYEQILAMLLNMSLNKKCHSHLANDSIINFLTCAYENVFYQQYSSRAETEAQRRCVKAILHTLSRLVYDSNVLGVSMPLPHFFKVANAHDDNAIDANGAIDVTDANANTTLDVSKLNLTRCESYV